MTPILILVSISFVHIICIWFVYIITLRRCILCCLYLRCNVRIWLYYDTQVPCLLKYLWFGSLRNVNFWYHHLSTLTPRQLVTIGTNAFVTWYILPAFIFVFRIFFIRVFSCFTLFFPHCALFCGFAQFLEIRRRFLNHGFQSPIVV